MNQLKNNRSSGHFDGLVACNWQLIRRQDRHDAHVPRVYGDEFGTYWFSDKIVLRMYGHGK